MSNYKFKGYRIDGVAACRLAWQWFRIRHEYVNKTGQLHRSELEPSLPDKSLFIDRRVPEPLAVRLAGEYDVWDKRDPDAELFQHGLRSEDVNFERLLNTITIEDAADYVEELLKNAKILSFARANEYRDVITSQGFDIHFEGLTFLACCSHEADIRSQLFEAGIKPHHDALFGFTFTGNAWRVSLYHAPGKEHHDLSLIAKQYGGGGHRGACGFITPFPVWMLPFVRDGKLPPTTADARVWTRTWEETLLKHPTIPHDEGAMIAWFANAIMAGYDEKTRQCATKS